MHFFHSIACFGSVFFLDSNRSDNPVKHTVHDKILDKIIESGKGQKVKAKQVFQDADRSRDVQVNIYRILPQENVRSVVCINFANETRWYTNQEMCTVDSSQLFNMFLLKRARWCQE